MTEVRLATDGKPFDEDNLTGPLRANEVEVIQYLRPDGRRRRMAATVSDAVALKAKAAGLVITAETIGNLVHITVRHPDDPEATGEYTGLAADGPGPASPSNILTALIEKCLAAKEPTDV